jgi:hypothetical protein
MHSRNRQWTLSFCVHVTVDLKLLQCTFSFCADLASARKRASFVQGLLNLFLLARMWLSE